MSSDFKVLFPDGGSGLDAGSIALASMLGNNGNNNGFLGGNGLGGASSVS